MFTFLAVLVLLGYGLANVVKFASKVSPESASAGWSLWKWLMKK